MSDVVRHWVCVTSRPYYLREEICPGVEMKSTKLVLLTYKGETVRPLGEAHMKVEYIGSQYTLPFLIVREGTGALFGRNWLTDFNLDWKNLPGLNHIEPLQSRPSVLEKKSELLQTQLGCYTGEAVVLNKRKESNFHKACPIPCVFTYVQKCMQWRKWRKMASLWRFELDAKSGPLETGDFGEIGDFRENRQRAGNIQNVANI